MKPARTDWQKQILVRGCRDLIGYLSRPGICLALVLVTSATSSHSQTPSDNSLETGKVIEKIVVQSQQDQSYAVYLPKSYTPEKRWPTVICLDPRARGRVAIERFTEAANEFGYIVLCSNNSRNGLEWQTVTQIFSSLWDDAHTRFSIDEKRTYAAGFSGGSRLAATFASRCRGCLAGIIACGAGFSPDIQPDTDTHFAYFGIAGVDDFNFSEMWELEKQMSQLKLPYRFETFVGGHEWPPAENIKRAFGWFSLQAMKTGSATRDETFLDEQLSERMKLADQLLAQHRWVDSYKTYASIARDFEGLRDSHEAVEKADRQRESADFKKEVRTEEELHRRQIREATEIRMAWFRQPDPDAASLPRQEAIQRVADWRKKRDSTQDSPERRLARRIISQLLIASNEEAQAGLRAKNYSLALANLALAHEVDQKNANVVFEMARIHAIRRDKKSAVQFLEQAVTLGFRDVARLKAENAFSNIAEDPRYQKILATLGAK